MSDEEQSARRVGTTLKDKWVLEQLIGVGGMASVYVARHKIGRVEAVKILHANVAASPQLRARFEQEAHAVNAFKHPGVVEVRDIDTAEDGAPFMVMELLDGESLGARARRDPLDTADVLRIAVATLDVLEAAHARGIIHRDIKPDNLFLLRDGGVKVLDFGIARVRSGAAKVMKTKAGVTLGTMAYMPPEQARGDEIDARADVYAMGATMFRLVAKRLVHEASTDAERVMKVLGEPAPRISSIVPELAPDIGLVIDRALAYDRDDRYPDAATMKRDVEALSRGEPPPFARAAPPLPERPPSSDLFSFSSSSSPVPSRPVSSPGSAPKAPPPNADMPTVVPLKEASSALAPDAPASRAPTAVGVAPEVAPTRIVAPGPLPADATPSTRIVVVPPRDVPAATPTMMSGSPAPPPAAAPIPTPFGQLSAFVDNARARPQMTLILAAVGGAVLLAMIAAVVIALFVVRAGDDATDVSSPLRPTSEPPATSKPVKPSRSKR